jgi:hypothetical protein
MELVRDLQTQKVKLASFELQPARFAENDILATDD